MIPEINEIEEIIKNTKNARINVKETIMKTVRSGWMNEDYYVSLTDGEYLINMMNMEDIEYNFLEDDYFDFINKQIEEDGIYIALANAFPEYEDFEDIEPSERKSCVSTWKDNVEISLPKGSILGDETTDYGIQVFKKDEKYEIIFSFNDEITFGHAMGYREISSIEDKLEEPLHRVIIKLMNDAIIFEE